MLDQSAKLNGTLAYRSALAAAGAPTGGTGKGVVVGVIDTGLDVKHPDFRDASGNTRVAWLIDMAQPPIRKHPELESDFGCAIPCRRRARSSTRPTSTRGSPIRWAFYRRMPLGTVRTWLRSPRATAEPPPSSWGARPRPARVAAGLAWIGRSSRGRRHRRRSTIHFRPRRPMGMPAVINLSLGGDFGPHDGSTPLEKALAAMVGADHPGRAIIVAAGNSGAIYRGDRPEQTLGIHTHTRVSRELPARVPVLSPGVVGGEDVQGSVYVWASFEKTADIAVGLEGPRGMSVESTAPGHEGIFASGDGRLKAAIFNSVAHEDLPLSLETHGAVIAWDGRWPPGSEMFLRFEGEGFVDVWMQPMLASGAEAYFEVSTRAGTINVPATHPDLIAVGCTVNRTGWTDLDANAFDVSTVHGYNALSPVDSTCYFSSAGPTATGAMKPEISAPGALLPQP